MDTMADILGSKNSEIISVSPNASLREALTIMAERNVGAVLVISKDGVIDGIFSERDLARKSLDEGFVIDHTKVKDVMTSQVLYVETDTSIQDCMSLMTEKRIRHLPVFKGDKLMGVISIGDVVKALINVQGNVISEQASEIGMLINYISGRR